jgi:DNA (cytosine-5)-methyltransferase 1
MKVLDLFSGIGGFSLGLERVGMETVAFCEIDPFCQKVLKKHWPSIPIFNDVRSLDYDGTVDVITGGYPCQPFSLIGQRKGEKDDRHLWPAMLRLIKKHNPYWIISENVVGHVDMGLDQVLHDLENEGYAAQTFIIPALAVGLPHERYRLWIIANNDGIVRKTRPVQEGVATECSSTTHEDWSNFFIQSCGSNIFQFRQEDEHIICGKDDGVSGRVDRLKSLGNAVVPQIPEIIGRAIMEIAAP